MRDDATDHESRGSFWYCHCRRPNTPVWYAEDHQRLLVLVERLKAQRDRACQIVNDRDATVEQLARERYADAAIVAAAEAWRDARMTNSVGYPEPGYANACRTLHDAVDARRALNEGTNHEPCGRGVCALEAGHEGDCDA